MARTTLDFSAYIAERTKDFTGREWVFAEIDRWLADPNAPRYFIITGEPEAARFIPFPADDPTIAVWPEVPGPPGPARRGSPARGSCALRYRHRVRHGRAGRGAVW